MQSLGNFNGLTASSLLLCESEVVDELYKLTTKHTDEYMASGLVEELFYLKSILTEENLKKVKQSLVKDKSGSNKNMEYLLKGIGEILFLRNQVNKDTSNEHFEDDDDSLFGDIDAPEIGEDATQMEGDLFESNDDLFESETDLFGSETDLFGGMGSGNSNTGINSDITSNTALELIEIGRRGFNITTGLVYELEEDWIEFKNYTSFFNARFRKFADQGILQSVATGNINIKPSVCDTKPRFKYAIEDSHLSLYQLSLQELNHILNLQEEVNALEIEDSDIEIEGDLAYDIYKRIYDRANSIYEPTNELVIDRYIRIFKEKACTLGGTKVTLLQTPVNRLQHAFSNYNTITKAHALMNKVNAETGEAQIDIIAEMLDDILKAKEYISMFDENLDKLSAERTPIETDIAKYLKNLIEDKGAPAEINYRVRDMINILLRNKLIKPKVMDTNELIPNLYALYRLYYLASHFELEKIDNTLTFNDFIDLNRRLVETYHLIPLSVSDIYVDAIIQNYKVKQNGTKEYYHAIKPNLSLIEKNLQSKQTILVKTLNVNVDPEQMPFMNKEYNIFLTVGTGGNK